MFFFAVVWLTEDTEKKKASHHFIAFEEDWFLSDFNIFFFVFIEQFSNFCISKLLFLSDMYTYRFRRHTKKRLELIKFLMPSS